MRVWVLGLAACVSLGCASPSREERGQVWCEHEGWWSTPHSLGPSEPEPLDLDLIGGDDPAETKLIEAYAAALEAGQERNAGLLPQVAASLPRCQGEYYLKRGQGAPAWDREAWRELQGSIESAYSAVLSSYEAALLRDIDSHQRAIWQRLADLVRLARRQASEAAWRTLADSFLEGKRLRTGFQQAERIQEEFTQLLYSLDAGKTPESTAQRFFSDARFKELLQAVRRIWALAGRDSRALTRSFKNWRRRALTREPDPVESLEALSLGAERYRDRALDAALDATLSAEGARGER